MEFSRRILFVDDDPAQHRALERLARSAGLEVDATAVPHEALHRVEVTDYGAILVDYDLEAGLSGVDLIGRLAKRRPGASFLLVTGARELSLDNACPGAGLIAEIVYKPWHPEGIIRAINGALELAQQRARTRSLEFAEAQGQGQEYRVLVVEDSNTDFAVLNALLGRAKYDQFRTHHIKRIGELEDEVSSGNYDAVAVDLSLPDARGLTAVSIACSMAVRLPVIAYSGSVEPALARQALALGAQDVIEKGSGDAEQIARAIAFAIERQRCRDRWANLATRNSLTNLPNRRLFRDSLHQAIARSRRQGRGLGLMFLDLDGFKAINDRLGHAAGDALLIEVGKRLGECTRESDTLAHLSGDEFTIIVENAASAEDVQHLAERIYARFSEPIELKEGVAPIGLSIGIALLHSDQEMDDLVRAADEAMYLSKRGGRNRCSIAPRDLGLGTNGSGLFPRAAYEADGPPSKVQSGR